jgi:hypothetical protein
MTGDARFAVEVVEPTLEDFSGHCFGLVASFCRALEPAPVRVWAGRNAATLALGREVRIEPVFSRRWRLLQSVPLYARLLRGATPVFVTTAKSNDLRLLDLVARGRIEAGRVFLYFHWVRDTPKKRQFAQRMAARQPEVVILGTTPTVADFFRECGFRHVLHQPYPMTLAPGSAMAAQGVTHLLYAGAARQDKGFGRVVDLVEHLHARGESLPVKVQVSADHYGKYDSATEADIARLRRSGYGSLQMLEQPLAPEEYGGLFDGAICVQAYDPAEFRDRVSGVTLDALARGCPVIATEGTWSARLVAQHGAGIVVGTPDAPTLYGAVTAIRADYAAFRARALAAGNAEAQRSWAPLMAQLEVNRTKGD